jgi:tagaturonate epimerase
MISKSVTFIEPDPIFEQHSAARMAEKAGFVAAFGPAQIVHLPEHASELGTPANRRLRVDPSDLIIAEAPLLNEGEQAEALAALVSDGVFESRDWPSRYLDREFPLGSERTLRFEMPSLIVTGIKFGWAIEQAARIAAATAKVSPKIKRLEIALDAPVPVTPEEHLFVGLELQRRGIAPFDLVLPWGGRWEPAVDWIGEVAAFEAAFPIHCAIAAETGEWRMSFDHAEQKLAVLPILGAQCRGDLHLNFDGVGWTEAIRILAQHEPNLFRELLMMAQDRFAFDKPNAELATTEDDIRSLPDVPDSELERAFVEDFRGRQLLRVTAPSLLGHETLGQAIRAAVDRNREQHEELVEAEVRRHLAPWIT